MFILARFCPVRAIFSGLLCLAALLAGGCSPRVSLLYVDYEVEGDPASVEARVAASLEHAGWTLEAAEVPHTVRTGSRTFQRRLLYRTVAYLEAVPIGATYMRIFIHPFRHAFIGSRNKIPYLSNSLRRSVFAPITEELERQEIYLRGAPRPDLSLE
jgi:hypothetical protein